MQQTHGCSRDINLQKLQKWSTAFTVDTVKILLPPMFTASIYVICRHWRITKTCFNHQSNKQKAGNESKNNEQVDTRKEHREQTQEGTRSNRWKQTGKSKTGKHKRHCGRKGGRINLQNKTGNSSNKNQKP